MSDTVQYVPPSLPGDASADSSPLQAADMSSPVTTANMSTPVTTANISTPTLDILPPCVTMDATQSGEQVVEKPQSKTCQSSFQAGTMLNATGNTITTRCWKPTNSLHPR